MRVDNIEALPSAQSLRELHERGGTREDIEGALKVMPFVRSRSLSNYWKLIGKV